MSETRFTIIRKADIVADAPDRWARQYASPHWGPEKKEITRALQALKGTDFSADAVDSIIGNRSWTSLECDLCDRDGDEVVRLGDENAERFVDVCPDCLTDASALFPKRGEQP